MRKTIILSLIVGFIVGGLCGAIRYSPSASADVQRYHTNCLHRVSGIAARSNTLYYTCDDPGDKDIYVIGLY